MTAVREARDAADPCARSAALAVAFDAAQEVWDEKRAVFAEEVAAVSETPIPEYARVLLRTSWLVASARGHSLDVAETEGFASYCRAVAESSAVPRHLVVSAAWRVLNAAERAGDSIVLVLAHLLADLMANHEPRDEIEMLNIAVEAAGKLGDQAAIERFVTRLRERVNAYAQSNPIELAASPLIATELCVALAWHALYLQREARAEPVAVLNDSATRAATALRAAILIFNTHKGVLEARVRGFLEQGLRETSAAVAAALTAVAANTEPPGHAPYSSRADRLASCPQIFARQSVNRPRWPAANRAPARPPARQTQRASRFRRARLMRTDRALR